MTENTMTSASTPRRGKLKIVPLLRSHWKALSVAFLAVLGETLSDVLEPWPIKIVVDSISQSKKIGGSLGRFILETFGQDKIAILNFAVAAVAAIAILGAVSSYLEKYLTTTVSQWVTHDL